MIRLFQPSLRKHPWRDVQVTHSPSPLNDRSESALAVNPRRAKNVVGASKRFSDPAKYNFVLAAYSSHDAGLTWADTVLPLPTGAGHSSDPAVAFDNAGNVYIVGLPLGPGDFANGPTLGISINRSSDGGKTWGPAEMIHHSGGDDKQGAASDCTPSSPHFGNVYAAWDDVGAGEVILRFARTTDHGATWRGVGGQPAGNGFDGIVSDSFAPEITVARDGTVYIFWLSGEETGNMLKFVKSVDGGDSFSGPHVAVSGLTPISRALLGEGGSFPELPGGKFRVLSSAVGCAGRNQTLVFAWADFREGVSRVYHRRSDDGGTTWLGSASGDPLLTGSNISPADQHDFHPQLAAMPNGDIGCAFYQFGPKAGFAEPRIDVVMAVSTDSGASFPLRLTVTDKPWDPAVDAPLSHGDPNTTFIGEYFGLAANDEGFFLLWTDTRTGMQEMFSSRVTVEPARYLNEELIIEILFGIINDGGGVYITPDGHIHVVGPGDPVMSLLGALAMYQIALETKGRAGMIMQQAALGAIADLAAEQLRGLRSG